MLRSFLPVSRFSPFTPTRHTHSKKACLGVVVRSDRGTMLAILEYCQCSKDSQVPVSPVTNQVGSPVHNKSQHTLGGSTASVPPRICVKHTQYHMLECGRVGEMSTRARKKKKTERAQWTPLLHFHYRPRLRDTSHFNLYIVKNPVDAPRCMYTVTGTTQITPT